VSLFDAVEPIKPIGMACARIQVEAELEPCRVNLRCLCVQDAPRARELRFVNDLTGVASAPFGQIAVETLSAE
jgi:hypothetical protein